MFSDSSTTPQTSDWSGSNFGATTGTASLTDNYRIMQGADAPTRDEKIVVGIDASGNTSLLRWDGTSWTGIQLAGTVSETYWYGADVAYEQLSGDAVVVWNNGSQLQYAVWDGTSWSDGANWDTDTTPTAAPVAGCLTMAATRDPEKPRATLGRRSG